MRPPTPCPRRCRERHERRPRQGRAGASSAALRCGRPSAGHRRQRCSRAPPRDLEARLRAEATVREADLALLRERLEAAEHEPEDLRAIRDALTPPELPQRPGLHPGCVEGSQRLTAGAGVLLYSDGLTEARRDGELFGLDGVRAALRAPHEPSPPRRSPSCAHASPTSRTATSPTTSASSRPASTDSPRGRVRADMSPSVSPTPTNGAVEPKRSGIILRVSGVRALLRHPRRPANRGLSRSRGAIDFGACPQCAPSVPPSRPAS
jgi:Stage II sporulation protein E (SpoIIE)